MSINIKYRAHLTENYQLKSAQQLISKLQIQLGMEKEYSEELEEKLARVNSELETERIKNSELREILETERIKVKKLYDKYACDVQQAVKMDDIYLRKNEIIKEKNAEIEHLTKLKDMYLAELVKLRG